MNRENLDLPFEPTVILLVKDAREMKLKEIAACLCLLQHCLLRKAVQYGSRCLLPCLSMRSEAACVGCLPGWTVPRDPDLCQPISDQPELVPGECVNSDWMR